MRLNKLVAAAEIRLELRKQGKLRQTCRNFREKFGSSLATVPRDSAKRRQYFSQFRYGFLTLSSCQLSGVTSGTETGSVLISSSSDTSPSSSSLGQPMLLPVMRHLRLTYISLWTKGSSVDTYPRDGFSGILDLEKNAHQDRLLGEICGENNPATGSSKLKKRSNK